MQPSHGSAPLYPSIENESTACSAAGQLMGAEWPGSLKEPQCTISCPLRKSGGNQQQKAENFNSNIQSPENFVIVSNLKQLCQCGWSTPFDRVNILLFPILMFFRFSTCK
ncbi:hypothetical protein KIL84_003292 [Mauremys mutica]|uniref:Uncharacterized protein n=1 Tax=Mauremys mutica TaxID=74926 RepID=A0A9D3WTI5_9SAUR|nr:hypothetical protein KIL84_003292 [Mauremys mutica]